MTNDRTSSLSGAQLWPTMLFSRIWDAHATEAPNIIEYLRLRQAEQTERIASGVALGAKSQNGLFESDFDLFKSDHSSLRKLVHFIEFSLMTAVSVANRQEVQPQDIHVEFVDSWYHITNEYGYHDAHVHHGCSWCGIYYIQVGDSGKSRSSGAPNGGSRFYCPFNIGGGYRDYGNKYLSAFVDPPIEDGLLILFPSFLLHSGLPYRGSADRIVLAFNARAFLKP